MEDNEVKLESASLGNGENSLDSYNVRQYLLSLTIIFLICCLLIKYNSYVTEFLYNLLSLSSISPSHVTTGKLPQ